MICQLGDESMCLGVKVTSSELQAGFPYRAAHMIQTVRYGNLTSDINHSVGQVALAARQHEDAFGVHQA